MSSAQLLGNGGPNEAHCDEGHQREQRRSEHCPSVHQCWETEKLSLAESTHAVIAARGDISLVSLRADTRARPHTHSCSLALAGAPPRLFGVINGGRISLYGLVETTGCRWGLMKELNPIFAPQFFFLVPFWNIFVKGQIGRTLMESWSDEDQMSDQRHIVARKTVYYYLIL